MDNSNVDNNYIVQIDIYSQMFPDIDADLIKIIIDENREEDIIDILLKLSDEIIPTKSGEQSENKPKHNMVFCEEMYEKPDVKETEKDDFLNNDNREYTETSLFLKEEKNDKKSSSFLGNLFRRNTKKNIEKDSDAYLDQYDPYDRL